MRHPRLVAVSAWAGRWLLAAVVATLVALPWAVERGIESASFDDRVGTLPVRVSLGHNGYSTLDTGLLGKVYWQRTATGGFGAVLRSTGPPMADGTLASYVSPEFVRTNTQLLDDPDRVAAAYAAELRHQVTTTTIQLAVVAGVLGGSVLCIGWFLLSGRRCRVRVVITGGVVALGLAGSSAVAVSQFHGWEGAQPIGESYPLSADSSFSFSSPQTREIAEQVQPFIEKNSVRIRERATAYESAAEASLAEQLDARAAEITPRSGEVVVVAEADPQGSLVGTRVRRALYEALAERMPADALVLRTIAGDISSNGTVAESEFVAGEAAASPQMPVVAAKGDHDTDVTVDQLVRDGVVVPDTEVVEAGGLRVASARDPAFKALFGGLVVNQTGVSEQDAGAALRAVVDDEPADRAYQVVLHQPRAVEGYLGVGVSQVAQSGTSLTEPIEDGIPDVPAGSITYGHLHDPAGPWVLWNTDTDQITWTVLTQLGTAGGVEENPTFNRFSTPFSAPLKNLSVQLRFLNPETGLQTGLTTITLDPDARARISDRIDVGLPGGEPGRAARSESTGRRAD